MRSIHGNVRALVGVCAVLAILVVLTPAGAAPGDLDPSFGAGGTVDTPIGSSALVTDLAVQPDGKIVAGGVSYPPGSFTLARYQGSGALDTTGSGGIVRGPCCTAFAVALQPDGRVLLAGFGSHDNWPAVRLARYRPDGSLDSTFGTDGIATGPDGDADGLALQPDGKIVVAGEAPLGYAFQLVRFKADGTLDESFGSGGGVRTLLGSKASARAAAVLPDGKILAAGVSVPGTPPPPPPPPPAPPPPPPPGPPPDPWQMTLARYNADGTLDSSFGTGGVVKTAFGYSATIDALGVQPDGKVVVTGTSTERLWGPARLAMARYRPDGALDPDFGSGGIVTARSVWGSGLALQPDGMIVVAGPHGVARYRADGTPDAAFGTDGVATAGYPTLVATAVALQQDSRIVTAGYRPNQRQGGFALNRYFNRPPTTIAAGRSVVTYGRVAVLRGTVPGGRPGIGVQIVKRGCYEFGTRTIATAATGPGGQWRVRVRARSRTSFQAKVEAETSAPLVVQVRPKVTLSKVAPRRFRASVVSGHSLGGETLVLQRFAGKRWVSSKPVVLRRIAKRGSYRQPGDDACYAAATSRAIRG